jgi:CDP-4-dehydro-6-deoxyglucose reductase
MLQPWVTGIITKIEDETANTKRFYFQVPEWEKFDFEPGQFVTLDLPIHEKPSKRWRSYSIASWPDGSNCFELVIVLLEGGLGTTYLFNEVKVGTEITLRGPIGHFTLPETIDADLFLICTGTGIAPFRSMVQYIRLHQLAFRNIYLIFGCRKLNDALYHSEMKQLEKELPNFFYIPTYSREDASTGVQTGYVHGVYEKLITEKKALLQAGTQHPAHFFLCGWKQMIDEARERITALGYDRKAIHLELYG